MSFSQGMNINKDNPAYRAIKGLTNLRAKKGVLFAPKHNLLLADGKTYLSRANSGQIACELEEGKRLLLLDMDGEQQARLARQIGLKIPGDSTAIYLSAKKNTAGRLDYTIHNMPAPSSMYDKREFFDATGESREENALTPPEGFQDEEVMTAVQERTTQTYSAFFSDLFASPTTAATTADDSTPVPENQTWYFNQVLNWDCSQQDEHDKVTPQAQATYVSISFVIEVYLDTSATGDFQWLYLSTLGYQSVGASGMNQDGESDYHQVGWSNGYMDVIVDDVPGFSLYQNSPTNTNNSTQYTSSVSFDVGVSADQSGGGASASYGVSHSTTETLTDWGIKLNDLNNWTFYQNTPWDSRKDTAQDDMVDYNAAKFRYQVALLPNLSTGVMNFDTMTVWKNNAVSTNTVTVNVYLHSRFNYVGLKNIWPTCKYHWWGTGYHKTLPFEIDLSLVS